jgi:hypothetical protein
MSECILICCIAKEEKWDHDLCPCLCHITVLINGENK